MEKKGKKYGGKTSLRRSGAHPLLIFPFLYALK
jgi:hypothetical protein